MTDDSGNMEKHLQKVEQLKHQIEEQGEKITDSSYISVLLNCAPNKYDMVISVLEAQADVTPRLIINRLLEEYRKFQVGKEESAAKQALLTNQWKSTNQKQEFQKGKSGSRVKCGHCNKKGHKDSQCWIKHPELKPDGDEKSGRMK